MKPDSSKLLVVDDSPENRDSLSFGLARRGYQVEIAENGAQALAKLNEVHYDLVLLDQMMPGMSGLDLLRLLRATYSPSQLPVIMVSALDDSDSIVDALDHGANDYVVKPVDLPVMAARIQTQLSRTRADRENQLLDPLTGLGNRTMFLSYLQETLARRDPRKSLAVLALDLDGFQLLNDDLGHQAGDQALIQAANRFREVITKSAIHPPPVLARVGADEFALFLDSASMERAEALARTLLSCLSRPFVLENSQVSISACAGIALHTNPHTKAAELLRDARMTMFQARQNGKNRWQVFDPRLREHVHTRMAMALDLHQALERDQMVVFYQPKVELRTGFVIGFEALLRWRHPQYGLIQPSVFIPIAEETGLIIPLGKWVLHQACVQLHAWQAKFPSAPPLSMNVNVSVKQLGDPHLVASVESILAETGILPGTIKLEVTESAIVPEIDSVRDVLLQLRALRIHLKLDDFGTGYSSLSCLRALPFDSLKIDRSFVQRLDCDQESRTIVETILTLARGLHMTVVAEGVENEEQRTRLLDLGCEVGQGFLFSKPVEAETAEQLLSLRLAAA